MPLVTAQGGTSADGWRDPAVPVAAEAYGALKFCSKLSCHAFGVSVSTSRRNRMSSSFVYGECRIGPILMIALPGCIL